MKIKNVGVPLLFKRVYNSESLYDVAGSDGGWPSMYGNHWTNTFDVHLTLNSNGGISLFDGSGARADYTPDPSNPGSYIPPSGRFDKLYYDGGNGYYWERNNGMRFHFWTPNAQYLGASTGGYAGRLYQIEGRSHNATLTLAYTWDAGSDVNGKIAKIVATTQSGVQITLNFGDVGTHRLLASLVWPDGTTTSYQYSNAGDLIQVNAPNPQCNNCTPTTVPETFGYNSDHTISWAAGPKWALAVANGSGSYRNFFYDSSGRVQAVQSVGTVNFDPDGTGLLQQNVASGSQPYYTRQIVYESSTSTNVYDTDGHDVRYSYNPTTGTRIQQTIYNGSTNDSLTTQFGWTANNLVAYTIDPRNNRTDFSYDATGHLTVMAQPLVNTTAGLIRPTLVHVYDSSGNVVRTCNPNWIHSNGLDWDPQSGSPSAAINACGNAVTGVTQFAYTFPTYEPLGQLSTVTTPLGRHQYYGYNASSQGGSDLGIITDITGDQINQNSGVFAPHSSISAVDAYGNPLCASNGQGVWTYKYDRMGRLLTSADPDDNTVAGCSKAPGTLNGASYTTYSYAGTVLSTQSPVEHAAGASTNYQYDANGNITFAQSPIDGQVSVGSPSGVVRYYDGEDRLIEVIQPADQYEYYKDGAGNPDIWKTRFIYDLSQGGTTPFLGQQVAAYGDLVKSQEHFAASGWIDLQATQRDPIGRVTAKFMAPPGSSTVQSFIKTYSDASVTAGLMTSASSAAGTASYAYDAFGRITGVQYNDNVTPAKQYSYDPMGNPVSTTSSLYGTVTKTYDADDEVTDVVEAAASGLSSPEHIHYDYYNDGQRAALSVTPENGVGYSQQNLFQYFYRADGRIDHENVAGVGTFGWSYTPAGRTLSQSDPTGQAALTMSYDGNGLLASETFPGSRSISGFTYDNNGQPTAYAVNNAGTITNRTLTYNVHNEMVASTSSLSAGNFSEFSARGSTIANIATTQVPPVVDQRDGVPTTVDTGSTFRANCDDTGMCDEFTPFATFAFDANGRVATTQQDFFQTTGLGKSAITSEYIGTSSKAYDLENHLIRDSMTNWAATGAQPFQGADDKDAPSTSGNGFGTPITLTYDWGPDNHPLRVSSNTVTGPSATQTLHWDGNTLLFSTDANGNLSDLKIGALADVTPQDPSFAGCTVWERDATGEIVGAHNSAGYYGKLVSPIAQSYTTASVPHSFGWHPGAAAQGLVLMQHADGFSDGYNTIQGMRGYSGALGGFLTPDPMAGSIDDPMSQKMYSWNRNNPTQFQDPSGMSSIDKEVVGGSIGGLAGAISGTYGGVIVGGAIVAGLVIGNILAPEVFLPMEAVEIGAGVLEGMDTYAAADEASVTLEGLQIPSVLSRWAKIGALIGTTVGGHIGAAWGETESEPQGTNNDGFVTTVIWGDFTRLDGTVIQYFTSEKIHNAGNYWFHHGLFEDPFEGLHGSMDQMQAALYGGHGMLDYCGSCDASGMNPFPGGGGGGHVMPL